MPEVFLWVFNSSVAVSWLILAVIIVRPLLRHSGQEIICLLWLIVDVRLLLPFDIHSRLSLIPSREIITEQIVKYDHHPAINSGLQFVDQTVNPIFSQAMTASPSDSVKT